MLLTYAIKDTVSVLYWYGHFPKSTFGWFNFWILIWGFISIRNSVDSFAPRRMRGWGCATQTSTRNKENIGATNIFGTLNFAKMVVKQKHRFFAFGQACARVSKNEGGPVKNQTRFFVRSNSGSGRGRIEEQVVLFFVVSLTSPSPPRLQMHTTICRSCSIAPQYSYIPFTRW